MGASDPYILTAQLRAMDVLFAPDASVTKQISTVGAALRTSQNYRLAELTAPVTRRRLALYDKQGGFLTSKQGDAFDHEEELIQKGHYDSTDTEKDSLTRISLGDLSEAVVYRHGSQIGVYFRQTTNATEFCSSATTAYVYEPGGGAVAQGYIDTLNHPLPRTAAREWNDFVHGNPAPPSFQQAIEQQVHREMAAAKSEGRTPEITVAGLSRGGALAQLTASRWMRGDEFPVSAVYSVSSPMVGNQDWATQFNEMAASKGVRTLRMETGGDIVPKLPPLSFAPAGELFYFPVSPELGSKGILNPSPALLARDQELVRENNHTHNKRDLLEAIKMHASREFIDVYLERSGSLMRNTKGRYLSEQMAEGGSNITGGSSEEAALWHASQKTVAPSVGAPSSVPSRQESAKIRPR